MLTDGKLALFVRHKADAFDALEDAWVARGKTNAEHWRLGPTVPPTLDRPKRLAPIADVHPPVGTAASNGGVTFSLSDYPRQQTRRGDRRLLSPMA